MCSYYRQTEMMLALLLQNMDLVDCRSLQNYGVVFFLQIEVQVQYVVACAIVYVQ